MMDYQLKILDIVFYQAMVMQKLVLLTIAELLKMNMIQMNTTILRLIEAII